MNKYNKKHVILLIFYFFLYAPIMVMVIYSFNSSRYSMLWHGITFQWYEHLFHNEQLWIAIYHSVFLALTASTIATCLGALFAVTLYEYRFYGRRFFHGLIFLLIVTPDIVIGIALLLLFATISLPLGVVSLLVAHIIFCLPFVVITLLSKLGRFDRNLLLAAKDLGANDQMIWLRIILPLLWPALMASWLLCFTLSIDDVIISYFIAGPEFEILPLKIYALARLGLQPELNALCTVVLLVTVLTVSIAQWLNASNHSRQSCEK